jgi:hypothetical protein
MEILLYQIKTTIYFLFFCKKSAIKCHRIMCTVLGMIWHCEGLVRKFNDNDFEIPEAKHSGRSTDVDDDRLRELVEENDYSTTRVLAKELDVSAMSSCAMHRINLTYMFKLWLPHELT